MTLQTRDICLMAAYGMLWAAVETIAAFLAHAYSPFQIVWTRYGVHLIVLCLVVGWRAPHSLVSTRRLGFQLSRSLLMLTMPAAYVIGISRGLESQTLMAVFWITPLLILALARLLLSEPVEARITTAALLAALGGALILAPTTPPSLRILIWPLAMSASFSLYVIMTRSLRAESTTANLFYTALGVFLALSPFMPFVWVTPDAHDLLIMTAIGILGLLSLLVLDRVLHASSASGMAPLTALQAVASVACATALGRFRPTPGFYVGLALIAGVTTLMALLPHPPQIRGAA